MSNPIRLEAWAARTESQYATDPTPTAADNAIRLQAPAFATVTLDEEYPNTREDVVTGTLSRAIPGRPQGINATIEFGLESRGAGSAYSGSNLPESDPLIRACAWGAVVVTTGGAETVTYTPADTSHSSCTIYGWAAGNLYIFVGCRGTFTWDLAPGVIAAMRFTMRGIMRTAPATTALASATYDSVVAPANIGLTLTIVNSDDTWVPDRLSGATLESGGDVQLIPSGNAADGIGAFEIVKHEPMFVVQATTEALANYNPYDSRFNAGGGLPLNHTIDATVGSTQYNRIDLDVANAYLTQQPAHQEFNGLTAWELSYLITSGVIRFD